MKLEKIAVASGNKGKIAEIKSIFTGVEIVTMQELGFTGDIEETGNSFKENAKIKAETIAKTFNIPALSDDSGLCVESLDGAPGIYSARFSGEGDKENRKLLLKRMEHVTDRQNFAGRNRRQRVRLRQPVLFVRFEKVVRACKRRGKKLGFAPLPRA